MIIGFMIAIYLIPLILVVGIGFFIYYILEKEYKETEYYNQTKNSYLNLLSDKGKKWRIQNLQILSILGRGQEVFI